jgi:hypothetical protein
MPSWIGELRKRIGSSISMLVQPNIVRQTNGHSYLTRHDLP